MTLRGTRWIHTGGAEASVPWQVLDEPDIAGMVPMQCVEDGKQGAVHMNAFTSGMWHRVPTPAEWDLVREYLARGDLERLEKMDR